MGNVPIVHTHTLRTTPYNCWQILFTSKFKLNHILFIRVIMIKPSHCAAIQILTSCDKCFILKDTWYIYTMKRYALQSKRQNDFQIDLILNCNGLRTQMQLTKLKKKYFEYWKLNQCLWEQKTIDLICHKIKWKDRPCNHGEWNVTIDEWIGTKVVNSSKN